MAHDATDVFTKQSRGRAISHRRVLTALHAPISLPPRMADDCSVDPLGVPARPVQRMPEAPAACWEAGGAPGASTSAPGPPTTAEPGLRWSKHPAAISPVWLEKPERIAA
jgi:hypothetical protein